MARAEIRTVVKAEEQNAVDKARTVVEIGPRLERKKKSQANSIYECTNE